MLDGRVKAHFVDREPLEPHLVPSSDPFTLQSHRQCWMCCTVHDGISQWIGRGTIKILPQIQRGYVQLHVVSPLVHHRSNFSRTPSLPGTRKCTPRSPQFLKQLVEKQVDQVSALPLGQCVL